MAYFLKGFAWTFGKFFAVVLMNLFTFCICLIAGLYCVRRLFRKKKK